MYIYIHKHVCLNALSSVCRGDANFEPSDILDDGTGIGLIKVSTDLQYGGASKYLVFFTKAIH